MTIADTAVGSGNNRKPKLLWLRWTQNNKAKHLGIEHWDESRQRWILYRSEADHSTDCRAYPYEAVPGRIFLDTNVVPEMDDLTLAEDLEALMHIFYVGRRANWTVMASRKTLDEIENTPDPEHRERLRDFAVELISPEDEANAYASVVGRRMINAPFTNDLPDKADRELIGNAIGLECDVFCTRDRRTIVKKRERLRQLPIRVLTPLEWWRHVRPWAGLCT
jgi:hypothetical protein